jgi:hypothetical protein
MFEDPPVRRETRHEHGELERLRGELEVPVTRFTVGNGGTTATTLF